jgi:hypothetical protein
MAVVVVARVARGGGLNRALDTRRRRKCDAEHRDGAHRRPPPSPRGAMATKGTDTVLSRNIAPRRCIEGDRLHRSGTGNLRRAAARRGTDMRRHAWMGQRDGA